MSRLYQIKLKQFEDCKRRLESLKEEYEAASEQLDYTGSRAGQKRLEREQTARMKDMEQVAQQCDQLEAELQKFQISESTNVVPEALRALIFLLSPVNFETVTKAYRSCLSQGRPRLAPDTLEALVRQLADIPGEPNEPEPLLRFVSLLLQEPSLKHEQREALKAWAKDQGLPIQEERTDQLAREEVCLMVKVQPRSLNDASLGYLVSAALVNDPNPFKPEVELIAKSIRISVMPDPKCGPGYSKDDLPRILDELITHCGNEYGIPLSELVIQWFLPIELMSLPVEHWQFQIGRSQKQCSGKRCKAVIIRSSDRHFSPYYQSAKGDWEKYWARLLACLESRCTETLVHLDPVAGRTAIDWTKSNVVGCKFVEHDSPQQQEALWDDLLGQGLPVAIWMRQFGTDHQTARRVMQAVTKCSIAKLSESLAAHRQQALSHASETDRLKAASLCLLLDNPFRPFPTLDYQSA